MAIVLDENMQVKRIERVYFETSAFNYFLKNMKWESFLGTRELQRQQGRELFVSPITLWELMLSRDVDSDFMLFAAQNLFSSNLLATPSELVVRFLRESYPHDSVNCNCFTDTPLRDFWRNMTSDNGVTIFYDQDELVNKTSFLRKISNNLSSIVNYPEKELDDEMLNSVAKIMHTVYECMEEDGFLTRWKESSYDEKIVAKLYVLWILGIFLLRFDMYNSPVKEFLEGEGLDDSNEPIKVVMHITEKYQELLHVGPILQMTLMSYHQLVAGRKNRGLLLDSMHCVYYPYVDTVLTNDGDFADLADQNKYFKTKTKMVEDIGLKEVQYVRSGWYKDIYIIKNIIRCYAKIRKLFVK